MRHSGDRKYADLLSAVRIGQVSDDQVSLLKQQLIAKSRRATVPEITEKYQELADKMDTTVSKTQLPKVQKEYN